MSSDRVRLFAALELPVTARAALSEWGREHLAGIASARRLTPESLHVTLCFLGWRAADDVAAISAACRAVGERRRGALSLGRPLWLPARRPRAVAIGLVDQDGALSGLQSALSIALQAGGWYEPERRPFLAHVTIARIASGAAPAGRGRPVLPRPEAPGFAGEAVTLYRSHVGSAGADYEPLETVRLTG